MAFLAQMLTSALSLMMQKKLNPDSPNMAGMMLTMPLLSLFIGGFIQVGVQQFYGPQRMLARERVKELTKQCDFEAQQMKKAEQANLNGEKTE